DDTEITLLTSETLIQNAGKRKKGENLEYKFVVRNTGEQPIEIDEIKTSHSFVTYDLPTKNLKVGESTTITVSFNTETLLGHQVISVELFYNELPKGLVL